MENIYLSPDGKSQEGPFTKTQVVEYFKKSAFPGELLVWYNGLEGWKKAKELSDFKPFLDTIPPQLPVATVPVADHHEGPPKLPGTGSSKKAFYIGAASFAGLAILSTIAFTVLSNDPDQGESISQATETAQTAAAPQTTVPVVEDNLIELERVKRAAEERNAREEFVKEEAKKESVRNNFNDYFRSDLDYSYREIGGMYEVFLEVANNSDYLIDNSTFKLHYWKKNGGLHKLESVQTGPIKPHQTVKIHAPGSDRGVKITQEIVGLTSEELGLNF